MWLNIHKRPLYSSLPTYRSSRIYLGSVFTFSRDNSCIESSTLHLTENFHAIIQRTDNLGDECTTDRLSTGRQFVRCRLSQVQLVTAAYDLEHREARRETHLRKRLRSSLLLFQLVHNNAAHVCFHDDILLCCQIFKHFLGRSRECRAIYEGETQLAAGRSYPCLTHQRANRSPQLDPTF
jgi:hypothetical protein